MAKISVRKSINFLLTKQYFSEFETIDKLNQHPDGIGYDEWLEKNHLLSNKNNNVDDTSVAEQMTCR